MIKAVCTTFIGILLKFFSSTFDHRKVGDRRSYQNSKHHILTFLRFFVKSIHIFAKIPVRKKKLQCAAAGLS